LNKSNSSSWVGGMLSTTAGCVTRATVDASAGNSAGAHGVVIPCGSQDRTLADDRRGFAFWYLWAGSFVNRLGAAVGPFLALYLTGVRDVGTAEAGAVLTAFGVGSALSQPVGGVLADRVGYFWAINLGFSVAVPLGGWLAVMSSQVVQPADGWKATER
jgi:nitrate/nitrite transporter NarK